jgi:two-component system chemotaxis sensor kinase CheA
LPVVLVTGLDRESERRRALDLGANAYIVKARFDQRLLLDTLQALLP